jgi:hypothetical protein
MRFEPFTAAMIQADGWFSDPTCIQTGRRRELDGWFPY